MENLKFLDEEGLQELVDNVMLTSTEYSMSSASIPTGTVGRRVHQSSFKLDESKGSVIGCYISFVSTSSYYIPFCFTTPGYLLINAYAATSGSFTMAEGDIKATVVQCKGVVESDAQQS